MTSPSFVPRADVSTYVSESRAACRSGFCVGGISVAVAGLKPQDVALVPSLEPFRAETQFPDIQIQVEWERELLPTLRRQLFDSGCTWRLYECGKAGLQFDFHVASFGAQPYKRLLIDNKFSHAILQLNESAFAGSTRRLSPWEYPLDELLIMHRITQERAIELHGCGIVGADGIGNLFVGHSGAGKSTTTRLWTESESVEVLSDDRIIVRRDDRAGAHIETPRQADAAAIEQGVLRLRDRSSERSGHFAQDDNRKREIRMYGTPWHGEEKHALPASAPLARIFVLEHGHGNVITRLTPGQAVAELFARSFVPFHRHEYVEAGLNFLQEVVAGVPCYRYSFEPDQRAVQTILNFHD
jgi:hypothetical protein